MQPTAPKRTKLPRMGVHKASGQARVTLSGQAHYLGIAGTPEAFAKYAELIREWRKGGQQPLRSTVTAPQAAVTLPDLFDAFLAHADQTGRYRKRGEPTSQRNSYAWIARSIGEALGTLPVHRLAEHHLVLWRDRLEADPDRTRKGVNRLVTQAVQVLRWGRARGIVPKSVYADVAAIEPLKRGECGSRPERGRPRRAVTLEEAELVAAHANRQVAAMIRLQALTGMRPGEVTAMRWADIDRRPIAGDTTGAWVYVVHAGKTSHHGHVTRYFLPRAAQVILEQFPATPLARIFSPDAAMAERRAELRANRKTSTTKQTAERDASAKREYASAWGLNEYRHAVERACAAAGVPRFTPHELRHGFATWAANTLSLTAAAAAVNHRHLSTTQRYVHQRADDALAVAAAVQARVGG